MNQEILLDRYSVLSEIPILLDLARPDTIDEDGNWNSSLNTESMQAVTTQLEEAVMEMGEAVGSIGFLLDVAPTDSLESYGKELHGIGAALQLLSATLKASQEASIQLRRCLEKQTTDAPPIPSEPGNVH